MALSRISGKERVKYKNPEQDTYLITALFLKRSLLVSFYENNGSLLVISFNFEIEVKGSFNKKLC